MLKKINRNAWLIANRLGNLQFAILLLLLIAAFSSIGTFIEQGKDLSFYQLNYPDSQPLFGFISAKFILTAGLDHVYTTWWFILNLFLRMTLIALIIKDPLYYFFIRNMNFELSKSTYQINHYHFKFYFKIVI